MSAAAISWICGTARWPPQRLPSSIWPGRDASTLPGTTCASSTCRCCAAHLETMVRMSPLQSYSLEILEPDDETALIGAGVSALRALAT